MFSDNSSLSAKVNLSVISNIEDEYEKIKTIYFERDDPHYGSAKLNDLIAMFQKLNVVAVVGIAGSGKTCFTTYYAYQYRMKNPDNLAYKLLADNAFNLKTSCKALAVQLGLDVYEEDEVRIREFIKNILNTSKKGFLLFFDNVDDPNMKEVIDSYMPSLNSSKDRQILITSQDKHFYENNNKNFVIDGFSPSEANIFLREITVDSNQADALAKLFDYLPLGVTAAKLYIKNNNITIDAYLAMIQNEAARMVVESSEDKYIANYYPNKQRGNRFQRAAIKLAIDRLGEQASLLKICAFYAADKIPFYLLEPAIQNQTEDALLAKANLLDTLQLLETYSLIKTRTNDDVSIHRVTQSVVRSMLFGNELSSTMEKALKHIIVQSKMLSNIPTDWSIIMPHVLAFKRYADNHPSPNYVRAELLFLEGRYQTHIQSDAYRGNEALSESLRFRKLLYGGDNCLEVAQAYVEVGNSLRDLEGQQKALKYYRYALGVYQKLGSDDHLSEIANIQGQMAAAHRGLGKYKKALELFEQALKLQSSNWLYIHQGQTFCELGHYQQALELHQRVFESSIQEAEKAWVSIEYGADLYGLGRYEEAQEQHEKAIALFNQVDVTLEERPRVAWAENYLAADACALGDYQAALRLLEHTIPLFERLYRKNPHSNLGFAHLIKGSALRHLKKYTEAIEEHQKALTIYQGCRGKYHPDVATCYNELALDYFYKENNKEMENCANEALIIFQSLEQRNQIKNFKIIFTYAILYKLSSTLVENNNKKNHYLQEILSLCQIFKFSNEQIFHILRTFDPIVAVELGLSLNKINIYTVPKPSPAFKRIRQTKLTELDKLICSGKKVVITGMHGVGKSQLVMKFAEENQRNYQNCLWLNASNEETIRASFVELASKLHLDVEHKKSLIQSVYKELAKLGKNLLIFDNAASYDELSKYLPNRANEEMLFDFIVTTINQTDWFGWQAILMKPDSKDMQQDAIHYLFDVIQPSAQDSDFEKDVKALAQELGYLHLALAQAAHYIFQTKITIKDYLTLFNDTRAQLKLLQQRVTRAEQYEHTVYTVINISLEAIRKIQPKAIDILYTCAYLDEKAIPKRELGKFFFNTDVAQYNEIIKTLISYSFIDFLEDYHYFNVHCLIQETIRLNLEVNKSTAKTLLDNAYKMLLGFFNCKYDYPGLAQAVSVVKTDFIYRRNDSNRIKHITMMLPHTLKVIQHSERLGYKTSARFDLLYTIGIYYLDYIYDIKLAKKYLKQANQVSAELEVDNNGMIKLHRQLFKAYLSNAVKTQKDNAKAEKFELAEHHLNSYLNILNEENIEADLDRVNFYLKKIEYFDNQTIDGTSPQKIPEKHKTRMQLVESTKQYLDYAEQKLNKLGAETRRQYQGMVSHYFGTYHLIVGDYLEAKQHYQAAIEIKKEQNDYRELGRSYQGVGNVAYQLLRLEKSPSEQNNFIEQSLDSYKLALACRLIFYETLYHDDVIESLEKLAELFEASHYGFNRKQTLMEAIICRYFISYILRAMGRKDINNERKLMLLYQKTGNYKAMKAHLKNTADEEIREKLEKEYSYTQTTMLSYLTEKVQPADAYLLSGIEISISNLFNLLQLDRYVKESSFETAAAASLFQSKKRNNDSELAVHPPKRTRKDESQVLLNQHYSAPLDSTKSNYYDLINAETKQLEDEQHVRSSNSEQVLACITSTTPNPSTAPPPSEYVPNSLSAYSQRFFPSDMAIHQKKRPWYSIVNDHKLYFEEQITPGDGWCTLNAIGVISPQEVLNTLQDRVKNNDHQIRHLLSCAIESNWQATARGLSETFEMAGLDKDGYSILEKINELDSQIQAIPDNETGGQRHLQAGKAFSNYLSRSDVLVAYLEALKQSRYVDHHIAAACLALENKKLAVFRNDHMNDGAGQLSNDVCSIPDDQVVCLIFHPGNHQWVAHYNRLTITNIEPPQSQYNPLSCGQ